MTESRVTRVDVARSRGARAGARVVVPAAGFVVIVPALAFVAGDAGGGMPTGPVATA